MDRQHRRQAARLGPLHLWLQVFDHPCRPRQCAAAGGGDRGDLVRDAAPNGQPHRAAGPCHGDGRGRRDRDQRLHSVAVHEGPERSQHSRRLPPHGRRCTGVAGGGLRRPCDPVHRLGMGRSGGEPCHSRRYRVGHLGSGARFRGDGPARCPHLVMPARPASDSFLREVAAGLEARFGVHHATLQIETGEAPCAHPCGATG